MTLIKNFGPIYGLIDRITLRLDLRDALRPTQHCEVHLTAVAIPQFICQCQAANDMAEPKLRVAITANEHFLRSGDQVTEPGSAFSPMRRALCNGLSTTQARETDWSLQMASNGVHGRS